MNQRRQQWLFLIFISVLILIVFGKAFSNGYVSWDDDVIIQNNQLLRLPFGDFFRNAFARPYFADYMPLTLLTFWADMGLAGGGNPHLQHAVNIFLHIINTWLVFFLLSKYVPSRRWSVFLTLVFAIHPVQTETVMWASSRNGLLCGSLALACWLVHLRKPSFIRLILEALLYLLAFFSKSMAVALPLLFVFLDRADGKQNWKLSLKRNAFLVTLMLAAVAWRIYAFTTGVTGFTAAALDTHRILLLPLTILTAMGRYLELVFFPARLSIIYPPFRADVSAYLSSAVFVAFAAAAVYFYRRRRERRERHVLFFAALIICFLAPVIQILPRINFINDRYLYFPAVGFAGLGIFILENALSAARAATKNKLVKISVPVIVALLVVGTFSRAAVWSSNLDLWSDTAAKNPADPVALNNLAMAEEAGGKIADAIRDYEKVLALGLANGTDHLALNNLGILHSRRDLPALFDLDKAARFFTEGVLRARNPADAYVLRYNLAMTFVDRNDVAGALRILKPLESDLVGADPRFMNLLTRTKEKIRTLQSAGRP